MEETKYTRRHTIAVRIIRNEESEGCIPLGTVVRCPLQTALYLIRHKYAERVTPKNRTRNRRRKALKRATPNEKAVNECSTSN